MSVSATKLQDKYVDGLVEKMCAKITEKFPSATFAVRVHPTHRGAIIDAHVPTNDDFEVFDLVNPELDDLLIAENIAISIRALGPHLQGGCNSDEI